MKRLIFLFIIALLIGTVGATSFPTDYKNVTTFTYNISPTMGPQSNYQVRFILSNSTGVSGYYAPENVIYTNGSTRPDWNDIFPTTGLDTPLPFWIENGTQTATNCTLWVNVPNIAIGNTSNGKMYYGNSSKTTSDMNGYSTFIFFDDFIDGTLNTSQWGSATGTVVIANGEVNVKNTATSTKQGIRSIQAYGPTNTTFITRSKETANGSETYHDIGFDAWGNNLVVIQYNHATGDNKIYGQNSNDGTNFGNVILANVGDTVYHTYQIKWIGTEAAYRMDNNFTYGIVSTRVPTTATNVTLRPFTVSGTFYNITADYVAVGKTVSIEPTTSGYSTGPVQVPNIIYDTDIASDVDDVGALAMLNNMSSAGTINLVGVITDSENIYSAPCVYAINRFYGHTTIPIGAYKGIVPGGAAASNSLYTQYITNTFGISGETYANYSNSTTVYRQILANSTNGSVTIIVGGYYGALADLLRSPADGISSLNGVDLVRLKTSKLVSTAGFYPYSSPADSQGGAEWNFKQDPYNASYVFTYWPNDIVGVDIAMGDTVYSAPPSTENKLVSPIRAAYNMSIGNNTRQSWDQLGALYGGTSLTTNFNIAGYNGNATVNPTNGNNNWSQLPQIKHSYLSKQASDATLVYIINSTMLDPASVVAPINSSFTPNATTGYAYPWYVSFTDTSTGSPTTWNWSFGDTYTSTLQNPQHVYPVAGAYVASLNVTNATGGFSNSSQTLTLTTDDDTYLHSWMHFNTSITAGEKGVAWTNTGCSLDTAVKKFGAGSLLCTNGNNFLSSASSPSWDLSPTANEVEFWVNVSAMGAAGKPLISRSTGIGTANGWGIYSSDGTASGWKYWEGNSGVNSSASFTLPLNTWTHVEISKNATYVDIRLNGVNTVSYAHTGVYNTVNPFVIGAIGAGNEHTFNMDEFRFSSGVPRFTQDFSNSLMKVQYVGSLTGGIDTSPNSTFRYKTDPGFPSTIANQTNGGTHNRTVQVQNMTEANYVLGSVIWDPLRQFGMAVRLNLTDYPDLVLVSSNIDNVNGEASFNVSRGGTNKITALFNNRTNLVDVQMLYWNYTSDTTGFQFFGDGMIINGTTVAPIHNFIQTNITFAPWDFYPNFSASTTTPTTGQTVTFYDNTTGYPSAWNWSWGDGTWTNGTLTPSATHVYTSTGLKTVKMVGTLWQNYSITNTSTKTNYINVSASPSFTYQDIWMVGRYNQTFTVTDSQTGAPIPGVVISDANGQSFTATTGTGYLTEPAGVFVAYFVATGYVSKSVSYIVDGDATHAVQMTASTGTPQQNTWYTPWQVRIRIVDYYGMPLSNINVTANYIASTLPSTDTSWLVTAFGISSTVANDMVNSAKAMEGVTDDNGGLSFTMFKSLQYRLTITNTTLSIASTKTLYPSDQEYVIYVRTAGQGTANNTLAMRNGTLPWYSLNSTHISLNMTYVDTSLCTSQLVFRVWFRDNGTEVHNTTWSGFGASYVYDNHTVPKAPIGTEYLWGYNATTVC